MALAGDEVLFMMKVLAQFHAQQSAAIMRAVFKPIIEVRRKAS